MLEAVTRTLKAILYELLPLRMSDTKRLLRWAADNQYSVLRLCANVLVLVIRFLARVKLRTWGKIAVFSAGLWIFHHHGMGTLWLIMTGIALIFTNLEETRDGGMSAYSVFNKNFQAMFGQLTAEQLDRQLRQQRDE